MTVIKVDGKPSMQAGEALAPHACARRLGLTAPRRLAAVANPSVSRRTTRAGPRRTGVQRQPAAAEAAQLDLYDLLDLEQ